MEASAHSTDLASRLEQDYRAHVNRAILVRLRIVLLLGAGLFTVFSLLDRVQYPELAATFLPLRLGISALLAALFGVSYWKPVQERIVWLADAGLILAGAALCAMVYAADGSRSNYYQGINLVFLALFTINSFHTAHNAFIGLFILLLYYPAVALNPTPMAAGHLVEAYLFMGSTLLLVTLMTKLYQVQHRNEFIKTEELADANARLIEAERLKSEFFANVSHELRTPLTLILAPLESLRSGEFGELEERQTRLLGSIHNNAVRLLQMVSGLLDFSRLEAGKLEVRREALDVAALTHSVLEDFRSAAQQADLTCEFEADPPEQWLSLDRYLYERILFNLLGNAIKFTDAGGRITVTLRLDAGKLALRVSDTGMGIPAEKIGGLFEKFRQLEGSSTRRFEGTGLGLALVQEFAELLGGSVSVQSVEGQGSSFGVELPAFPAEPEAAPLPETSPAAGLFAKGAPPLPQALETRREERSDTPEAMIGPASIVVAEDNVELASYIALLLGESCSVEIARDGEEALERVRNRLPDALLCDVMMPGRDGLSVCRELKADPRTRDVPVILLTALTDRDALLRGWEAGADEYLFKPFHPSELVTRVRSIVTAGRSRRSALHERLERVRAETELAERRRSEQDLASLVRDLEDANRELKEFASIVSHDLKAPLRAIGSLAHWIATDYEAVLDEAGQEQLALLTGRVQRMSDLIDGILDYSRLGRVHEERQDVALGPLIEQVVEDLEPPEKVTIVLPPKLPVVRCQKVRIQQLFQNLIANAIKFGDATEPRIQVDCKPEDGGWHFSVCDNGPGIEERHFERIFLIFQTLAPRDEIEGTGVGLALAKRIVELHGGRIWVESRVGEGSCFHFMLPAADADESRDRQWRTSE